ncbi:MAG: phage portal protein [Cyanobacteria bacterium J06639_14]
MSRRYNRYHGTSNTQKNVDIFHGRFWPQSWIGPTVPPSASDYAEKMAHLERVFQSANILKECARNWRDGLISEPFNWYLKGEDGDRVDSESDTTAAAAEQQLQRWLDWVEQQAVLTDPSCTNFQQSDPWAEFVLSLGVTGEAALRLWQPTRYAEADDPVHRIHLQAPKAGSVCVERNDADGFIDEIRYAYSRGNEVHRMDGDTTTVESPEADEDGEPQVFEIDSDGRWLIQYVTGESIFTPSVKRLQNALNHALTMMVRNNEVAGFRERVFANAEFPEDSDGNAVEIPRGPGIDQYTYGVPTGDPASPDYADVTIHESQPIDNASLTESIETYRRLIYMQFNQGHLLSAGDGSLSGESRIQMRSQFELHLKGWKRRVESAIANILNIVLKLLGYESFEVSVTLNITTGKLSAEERNQLIAEHQAGLMSKATTIAKLGSVSDVDAELALMAEEAEEESAARDRDPTLPQNPLINPRDNVDNDDNDS